MQAAAYQEYSANGKDYVAESNHVQIVDDRVTKYEESLEELKVAKEVTEEKAVDVVKFLLTEIKKDKPNFKVLELPNTVYSINTQEIKDNEGNYPAYMSLIGEDGSMIRVWIEKGC